MVGSPSIAGPAQIFLVDKDHSLRMLLTGVLKAMGYSHVHPVESMWNAIGRLKDAVNPVIICDHGKSPNDVMRFIKGIRWAKDSPNRRVPIILLLYDANMDLIVEARDAGVNEVLLKPVSGQALKPRVMSAKSGKRPFIESRDFVGPCRRKRRTPFAGDDLRAPDIAPTPPSYGRELRAICSGVLEQFLADEEAENTVGDEPIVETVTVSQLVQGQTLAKDVMTTSGSKALGGGIQLNEKLILRLADLIAAGFIDDAFTVE